MLQYYADSSTQGKQITQTWNRVMEQVSRAPMRTSWPLFNEHNHLSAVKGVVAKTDAHTYTILGKHNFNSDLKQHAFLLPQIKT